MSYVTAPIKQNSLFILEEYSRDSGELINYAWSFDTQPEAEAELLKQMRTRGHESMYSLFMHVEF